MKISSWVLEDCLLLELEHCAGIFRNLIQLCTCETIGTQLENLDPCKPKKFDWIPPPVMLIIVVK